MSSLLVGLAAGFAVRHVLEDDVKRALGEKTCAHNKKIGIDLGRSEALCSSLPNQEACDKLDDYCVFDSASGKCKVDDEIFDVKNMAHDDVIFDHNDMFCSNLDTTNCALVPVCQVNGNDCEAKDV